MNTMTLGLSIGLGLGASLIGGLALLRSMTPTTWERSAHDLTEICRQQAGMETVVTPEAMARFTTCLDRERQAQAHPPVPPVSRKVDALATEASQLQRTYDQRFEQYLARKRLETYCRQHTSLHNQPDEQVQAYVEQCVQRNSPSLNH